MITRNFNLFLSAGRSVPLVINANQAEEGEQWVFSLFQEDGTPYTPTDGSIVGIKSDGYLISNSGTVVDGKVVISETKQMTAAAGKAVFELRIDGLTHGTANFIVLVEEDPTNEGVVSDSDLSLIEEALSAVSPLPTGGSVGQVLTKTANGSAWSDAGTPTQEQVADAVSDWADEHITVTTGVVIDTSLSVAGAAADAKATGDEISDLKSALFDEETYATATGSGSGTTQTATFSTALQANKKYKIEVEIDPSKTTTGNVYLSSGGTLTKIGEIASGSTEASFDVSPSSVCEAIRFNSTVNTETYSVIVKVQTPTYASKSELSTLSSEVVELQEQVIDLGYDADNIVTYEDVTILDNLTWTAGYVSKSGTISSSTTYSYSSPISVSEGDVITSDSNGNMFRFLCAYDASDNAVSADGMSTDYNSYTVPSGIVKVIVSRYDSQASYNVIHKEQKTEYVTPQKPMGKFQSAIASMSNGDVLTVPIVNASKNTVQAFSADITSFSAIQIGRKDTTDYGYLEIDDTNITIKVYNFSDVVIPHGLTITNNINVRIIQHTDGQENPTALYRGYIELSSNGEMFKTTDKNTMPQNYWTRSYCKPFVKSVGSTLTNCVLSYIPCDAHKKIYMFGDSYFSFYTDRWTYYCAKDGYDKNALFNAYAGENSANAVIALKSLFELGITPTYAVWCLGMNDGTDSASDPSTAWVDGRDTFLSQCKKYGVIPVFGTIPSVPNKSNEKKNEWIRASGYQYIDFAKAVGAQSDGTWYSGMLSNDNVHPTVAGGIALYGRVLTDFPQIAYSN